MKISHFLSLVRIPLGLAAIATMARGLVEGYLVLFVLGVISDSLDGFVARKRDESSKWGSFLDKISDQFFEFFLGLSLWLFATLPTYYIIPLSLRACLSAYDLWQRHRSPLNEAQENFNKKEVRLSSVLSLTVFFFYALALAGQYQAPSLSRGLMEIALPYVLLPLGALMEGINLIKLFPKVFQTK